MISQILTCCLLLSSSLFLRPTGCSGKGTQRDTDTDRKEVFVRAVIRGEGLMPWQQEGLSDEERTFRQAIEKRKKELLETSQPVPHPVFLRPADIDRTRRWIEKNDRARSWFQTQKEIADYVVRMGTETLRRMIPELTPTHAYGFTCPNCVGRLSQECEGYSLIRWDYNHPDVFSCAKCGQTYPDPRFPEMAVLRCPRMEQSFHYFLNERERKNPEDRSGNLAWHWVGYPIHVSFTGILREQKISFMSEAVKRLAIVYRITGDIRYARGARDILLRFADCYRNWLYHDYWDTIADCDPLFAAWHDENLRLEWKRHLTVSAYRKDTAERASMLQTYWGAGRAHPSTDAVSRVKAFCVAYDSVVSAVDDSGNSIWTPEQRAKVERDLLLEYVFGAEPFVGGEGRADSVNNKAPRVYHAQAAVGVCLGIPSLRNVASRGYEAIRDQSFLYDGLSTESPAYTNMYLSQLVLIPETLSHFTDGNSASGEIVFGSDSKLELMFMALLDQLRPDGYYLPLSDTSVHAHPTQYLLELGMRWFPDRFLTSSVVSSASAHPTEYAFFNLDPGIWETVRNPTDPPEIYFPAWMTALLRHGKGQEAAVASLAFSPAGGHRHRDNLSLYYWTSGKGALGDLGYVGDMPVNRWIRSTLSHNLVIVDHQEQRFGGDHPRVPAFRKMVLSPHVSVVEAESQVYDQCDEYRREILFFKGPEAQTFIVDIFRIRGGEEHCFRVFSEIASSDAKDGSLSFENVEMPSESPLPKVGGSLAAEDIFGLRDVRSVGSPPSSWHAVWNEKERGYRLWMLSQVDSVQASNGPGQETRNQPGRRVRYVDAVRTGENLHSVFVAVHEPTEKDVHLCVESVARLPLPASAGDNAVALKIRCRWGEFLVLSDVESEVEVEGVRFSGDLLVLKSDSPRWVLAVRAGTLITDETVQFQNIPREWSGPARRFSASIFKPESPPPKGFPPLPEKVVVYTGVFDGAYFTGFPIRSISDSEIRTMRFPLPDLTEFRLPSVLFLEE